MTGPMRSIPLGRRLSRPNRPSSRRCVGREIDGWGFGSSAADEEGEAGGEGGYGAGFRHHLRPDHGFIVAVEVSDHTRDPRRQSVGSNPVGLAIEISCRKIRIQVLHEPRVPAPQNPAIVSVDR